MADKKTPWLREENRFADKPAVVGEFNANPWDAPTIPLSTREGGLVGNPVIGRRASDERFKPTTRSADPWSAARDVQQVESQAAGVVERAAFRREAVNAAQRVGRPAGRVQANLVGNAIKGLEEGGFLKKLLRRMFAGFGSPWHGLSSMLQFIAPLRQALMPLAGEDFSPLYKAAISLGQNFGVLKHWAASSGRSWGRATATVMRERKTLKTIEKLYGSKIWKMSSHQFIQKLGQEAFPGIELAIQPKQQFWEEVLKDTRALQAKYPELAKPGLRTTEYDLMLGSIAMRPVVFNDPMGNPQIISQMMRPTKGGTKYMMTLARDPALDKEAARPLVDLVQSTRFAYGAITPQMMSPGGATAYHRAVGQMAQRVEGNMLEAIRLTRQAQYQGTSPLLASSISAPRGARRMPPSSA